MVIVRIDTTKIHDWPSFHDVFSEAFGFPHFSGRNMDAWADCLTSLDDPSAELTKVHVSPGRVVTLLLDDASEFAMRHPRQFRAVIDGCAFVNCRRIDVGESAVIALAYHSGPK